MVALNPCQIAICLSAIFTTPQSNDRPDLARRALVFAMGRAFMYVLLGCVLILVFKITGVDFDTFVNGKLFGFVDKVMPYVCLAFAIFFLSRALFKHHHNDNCHNSSNIINKNKGVGAFLLGAILALVFCPESAVLYFAVLIPMSISSTLGLLNIVLFALFAILPIVIIAKLSHFSKNKAAQLEMKFEKVQFYVNLTVAFLLLIIGLFLLF